MNILNNIPKKDLFNPPEGYFESLPTAIMSRLEQKKRIWEKPIFRYSVQYALPVVIFIMVSVSWFNQKKSTENLLASIETTELVNYLADADTPYEFEEEWSLTEEEAASLERAIYGSQWQDENALIQELDLNTL